MEKSNLNFYARMNQGNPSFLNISSSLLIGSSRSSYVNFSLEVTGDYPSPAGSKYFLHAVYQRDKDIETFPGKVISERVIVRDTMRS